MATNDLTASLVRDLLDYDPETGRLCWRKNMANGAVKAGATAGTPTRRGYLQIRMAGCSHSAHRVAWLHFHGMHAKETIDHINGDKSDNRICNLRDVSSAVNKQNMKHAPRKATGLPLGVSEVKTPGLLAKFQAQITANRKAYYLGNFYTAEDAHQAYLAAKRSLHAGCTI